MNERKKKKKKKKRKKERKKEKTKKQRLLVIVQRVDGEEDLHNVVNAHTSRPLSA